MAVRHRTKGNEADSGDDNGQSPEIINGNVTSVDDSNGRSTGIKHSESTGDAESANNLVEIEKSGDSHRHHHKRQHSHHHVHHDKKRSTKQWALTHSKRFMFVLGTLLGVCIAGYMAQSQELVSMDLLTDLSIDQWISDFKDMLPANVLKEASHIGKDNHAALSESFAVGTQLKKEGLSNKHPVVLIPGVISTGLESWGLEGTDECPSQPNFRKRLWGSWHMLRSMLLDTNCWLKHVMLDPETGLDPPNFKLRAAQGMEAADFFVAGYWIWNKILENLAALGYDVNTMTVASYDWRLAYSDLERRDRYFSKLKSTIEDSLAISGEKTVIAGHSMGSQIIFYFLKWVEAEGYGNGGPTWVNDHIKAYVDISGSVLGTPKAVVALLSGEMKDTVQLNALAVYGLEKFFCRRERADLLRTFGGIASMLPKGGDDIWGTLEFAPDDAASLQGLDESVLSSENNPEDAVSYGNFIRFKNPMSELSSRNLTISDSIEYLYSQTPDWFSKRTKKNYSHGVAKTRAEVEENEKDPSKWINPLEVALPNAPDMRIYCFYGIGIPTERSYYYQEEVDKSLTNLNISIVGNDKRAVVMGQGDGTVSLITHSMCHRWKEENSKFNPGGSQVKVVEMLHQPDKFDIRGGAKTAEHVDILGRTELNDLVLRVAAGDGDSIEEHIESNINDWVWNIDLGTN
ncbi:phospholipid:diacylglycerol acyltransferase [Sugiyamaella lignohabitans]|uniref:Phospholipid:diacylglycerol acyltransferase n=1 Tax=Sugiyamaella lignohabitans TaxID=796027 RepID=A0A161HNX9_9ASCO|nr:phospholipid:diacylglycerol acyltransferase [Sugiyamaella lignohabitans]ANB15937.1 phospholipid:diacylglycerol acyltransferase [Sugiyamaella lignohabitans]